MVALVLAALLAQAPLSPPPDAPRGGPGPSGVLSQADGTGPTFGAVFAPAVMPKGATALYAILGAPNLGGGYRQGFGPVELEARLLFDYLLVSGVLEVAVKFPVFEKGKVQMAPVIALGVEADSGATYFDKANFSFFGIRPRLGMVTAVRLSDIVSGILTVDVPWSIPVSGGGGHLSPSIAAGAEIYLGSNISGLLMGEVGLDAIKQPLGVTQYGALWGIRIGIGFRLF